MDPGRVHGMSDHALHFVIRHGVWWVAGGQFPPLPMVFGFFFFFGLSAQSRTVMMIIPLPMLSPWQMPPLWLSFLFVGLFVFGLSAQQSVMTMIVPTHYDFFLEKCVGAPPPPTPRVTFFRAGAKFYGSRSSSETFWQFCPPPKQSPWRCPLPLPHYGNNFATKNFGLIKCVGVHTPPADCRFQSWRNAQRDILPGLWKCC